MNVFFFVLFFHSSSLPTRFFIILAYAVWRGPSGCKSFKRVWMEAHPLRTGTRCIPKLIQSEWSILSFHDLVLHLTTFSQWCIVLLCCSIKTTRCWYSFTDIFHDARRSIEIKHYTVWVYNFSSIIASSTLISNNDTNYCDFYGALHTCVCTFFQGTPKQKRRKLFAFWD